MPNVKVPKNCTCGTKELCRLHFVAEDFYPGALVTQNPYSAARWGEDERIPLGKRFRVISVRQHPTYPGNLVVEIDGVHPPTFHHGYFIPDHFMSMARKAIQEETDANKL